MFIHCRRFVGFLFLAAGCATLSGCLITTVVGVLSKPSGASLYDQSVDANGTVTTCAIADDLTQTCSYSDGSGVHDSTIVLGGVEALFVQLEDPLIAQVPANATNISGTFDNGQGVSGALVITAGLTSIPADANTNLVAQPGKQLIIIDLPPGSLLGSYKFTFKASGSPPLIQPMFAGKVPVVARRSPPASCRA